MKRTFVLMVMVVLFGFACEPQTKFIAVKRADTETASQSLETDSAEDTATGTTTETEAAGTDSGTNSSTNTDAVDTEDTQTAESDSDANTDDTQLDTGTETESEVDTTTDTASDSNTDSCPDCGLPESFAWESTPPIILPAEGDLQIKDPTVVYYDTDDEWVIYATARHEEGSVDGEWGMTFLSVADWDNAGTAPHTPVGANNPNLGSYKVSPQLFYFRDHALWYLIFQTQEPAYSTSMNPTEVSGWTPPEFLWTRTDWPDIVPTTTEQFALDYWVICDDETCFVFFTALDGKLYRARTPRAEFPNGFAGSIDIVLEEPEVGDLFQGCSLYAIHDNDTTTYLLLVMAFNAAGDGRFFRAWTGDALGGNEWNELAGTEANAFASLSNVTMTGEDWAFDGLYQGEILRRNPDETMTIDPNELRFLYQGLVTDGGSDAENVYGLGLLTPVP